MTGEITLRQGPACWRDQGKILAARRMGMNTVVLCAENKQDVEEVPARYRKGFDSGT